MIRRPRQHCEAHLRYIRQLPCVICGNNIETEAAHIRFAREEIGKRKVGVGEKPDDKWTVPLCGKHHREQHQHGERAWWADRRLDPIKIAQDLWAEREQEEMRIAHKAEYRKNHS